MGSTASGSDISTCQAPSESPASSIIRNLSRRLRPPTAAARRHGKAYGRLVPDTTSAIELFNAGFDFICYSGDVWMFQEALSRAVSEIRSGCSGEAP